MRKSLLLLGVAVAALASCTQNEVLDIAESNVIKFDNAFVGNTTKATTAPEVTTDNIEDMYVFAVDGDDADVFDDQPKNVYKVEGTSEWSYDNLVAWNDAKSYEFIAYAGKNLGNSVTYDNGKKALKFENITVNGQNQFDLLYSNLVERTNSGSLVKDPIEFTFGHLLSMVQFTLKSGFGATTEVTITNFKFYGLRITESYDATVVTPAWTATSTVNTDSDTDFTVSGEDVAQSGKGDVVNSWVVIPQKNTESASVAMVSFHAKVTDGGIIEEKDLIAKIPSITWEKGYRYNYIFTITPENMDMEDKYITFEAPTVTEWVDQDLAVDDNTSSTVGVEF